MMLRQNVIRVYGFDNKIDFIHLLQVMMTANGQQVIVQQQQQQPQPQVVQQAQVLSVRAPNGQVVNINPAGTAAATSTAALSAAPAAAAAPTAATTVNIPGIGNVQVGYLIYLSFIVRVINLSKLQDFLILIW